MPRRRRLLSLLGWALFCTWTACASVEPARPARGPRRGAACQIEVGGDEAANWRAIEAALARAADLGADLVCFPETCLFGWLNPEAHLRADPVPGAISERLAQLARRHGLMLAIGLAEREGGRLYDSALLFDRDGTLLLRHRKVNVLSELMDPPYSPGEAAPGVVDTRLGRVGLLICADSFVDELVGQLAAAEPDLVLVPFGWAAPAEAWPEHGRSLRDWVVHTARRTGAPVLGVDATGSVEHGPWKGFLFGGQSLACDREGRVQGVLADRAPEVRLFELL
jgi:N-carbamoylputrescine amidase